MNKAQLFDSSPSPNDITKVLHNGSDDAAAPQVPELHSQVNDTISTATSAITAKALRGAGASTRDFVRDNPWMAIRVTAG